MGVLEEWIGSESEDRRLCEDEIRSRVMPLIKQVPAIGSIYHEVEAELEDPSGSLEKVAELISIDPVLAAKVLQTCNSAAFGFRNRIGSVSQAVMMLGGERVKSLILFVEVASLSGQIELKDFYFDRLWKHSLSVAAVAREIMLGDSKSPQAYHEAEMAFSAGLIHDLGKLLLAVNIPDQYADVLTRVGEQTCVTDAWSDVERSVLGVTHAEVGGVVLESWGLPYPVLRSVCYHHDWEQVEGSEVDPHSAVMVANTLVHLSGRDTESQDSEYELLRSHWEEDTVGKWEVLTSECLSRNPAAIG